MTEITAPIIAITLVLLSVFVPVAFIPGVSGQLFRQFAVTISIAMLISAINALTLSPALCAIFLRHRGARRGPLGWVLRRIDNIRDGYAAAVRRLVRVSVFGVALIAASAAAIWALALRTPTGFLPEEDQGAFFVIVQLPDGASVYRTREAVSRITKLLQQMPQVDKVFAIIGFSIIDGVNEPNAGFIVPLLKPFADRAGAADSAQALIGRVFAEGQQVRSANVIAFNLPPIIGLSTTGGFEYDLEGLEGQEPAAMNSVMQALVAAANHDPRLTHVFSTYTASNPSIWLDIDREKAQALGLGMNDVFGALQATLGGVYINNFNLFGRVWQVNIEGEAADRNDVRAFVADLYPQQIRHRRAAAVDRKCPGRRRPAGHHPLQQLPGDPDSGQPVARDLVRGRARGDGRRFRGRPCRRLQLRMDRNGVPGSRGFGPDRGDPRSRRAVRVPVSGRPLRKLDHPDPGAAVRPGRGLGRVSRHPDLSSVA